MSTGRRTLSGQYELIERVGAGGMGEVWRARDLALERTVALKFLRSELATNPAVVERFRAEAVVLAKLHHPNIATLYTVTREGSGWYMVMEYVAGTTLDRVLASHGRVPWREVIDYGLQALAGIGHAHAAGIIHRDIKPANLMVTPARVVKVMDFGIARVFDQSRLTRAGNWVGTVEYVSPEQIRGEDVDPRADIYSLAIVMYELVTGRLPFDAKTDIEQLHAQLSQSPRWPSLIVPDIPRSFEAVLLRALAKSRRSRYANAAEFAAALTGLQAGDAPVSASHRTAKAWLDAVRARALRAAVSRGARGVRNPGAPSSGAPAGAPEFPAKPLWLAATVSWLVANPILACAAGLSGLAVVLVVAALRPTFTSSVNPVPPPSMQPPATTEQATLRSSSDLERPNATADAPREPQEPTEPVKPPPVPAPIKAPPPRAREPAPSPAPKQAEPGNAGKVEPRNPGGWYVRR